jgi:hypothetical protein
MNKATVTVQGPTERKKVTSLLGKFSQKSFYLDLLESVIREMFRAAALAFAAAVTATITRQIHSDRTPQNAPIAPTVVPPGNYNDGDLSRRAYGSDNRGYENRSYGSSYPSAPPAASQFPGFGR